MLSRRRPYLYNFAIEGSEKVRMLTRLLSLPVYKVNMANFVMENIQICLPRRHNKEKIG